MVKEFTIPHGSIRAFKLRVGDRIKIETVRGGQVADLVFKDFSQSFTRDKAGRRKYKKSKQSLTVTAGDILYDNDCKPVLEILEDKSRSKHDLIWSGCRKEIFDGKKLGCRDMLSKALRIPRLKLPATFNIFMDVEDLSLTPSRSKPGDHVILKALVDVEVGITACPGESNVNPNPSEIRVTVSSK